MTGGRVDLQWRWRQAAALGSIWTRCWTSVKTPAAVRAGHGGGRETPMSWTEQGRCPVRRAGWRVGSVRGCPDRRVAGCRVMASRCLRRGACASPRSGLETPGSLGERRGSCHGRSGWVMRAGVAVRMVRGSMDDKALGERHEQDRSPAEVAAVGTMGRRLAWTWIVASAPCQV